ncbi:cupin domain-containing protein [uncultured Piscinibacter sp.]|uniref:cupin domain-containing protein n=1 Tax=uncultured Piscinibacter sp. TaxID=1131835 RepID=UPI0026159DC1|nr:cupin domain-containing protein [uncultured Piscinibacter sp.]
MLMKKSSEREWIPTGSPGVERSLFRHNDSGGRSSVVRLAQGSRVPRHVHHGTEEVLVLAGRVSLDGVEMAEGDYLYVEAGEQHDVVALSDAVIFVSSQRSTSFVEG